MCTSCRLAKCFASGMQVDLLRAPRTVKNHTNQKPPVTTISTISTTQEEKDQPQQVRFFIYLIFTVQETNLRKLSKWLKYSRF